MQQPSCPLPRCAAGEWQSLTGDAEPAAPSTAPLFVSWDWKAHLQKKARLAVSGG